MRKHPSLNPTTQKRRKRVVVYKIKMVMMWIIGVNFMGRELHYVEEEAIRVWAVCGP